MEMQERNEELYAVHGAISAHAIITNNSDSS